MAAITFREWFDLECRQRGCEVRTLQRWFVRECEGRGVKVSEHGIRALLKREQEPRRPLRVALMEITGLPATSFLVSSAASGAV